MAMSLQKETQLLWRQDSSKQENIHVFLTVCTRWKVKDSSQEMCLFPVLTYSHNSYDEHQIKVMVC